MAIVGPPVDPYSTAPVFPIPNNPVGPPTAQEMGLPYPNVGPGNTGTFAPPVPAPEPQEQGFFEKLKSTPEGNMALIQMIGGLMQPVGAGQSAAGVFGEALNSAGTSFMKNKQDRLASEQGQQKIDETQRQDVESNAEEASTNRLKDAQAEYYKRMPAGGGMTTAQYDAQKRDKFKTAIMQEYPGMTDSQAELAITMGEANDFQNFPSIAKAVASVKLAENMSFMPTDVEANLAGNTTVGGTGTIPFDPQAVSMIGTTPAEDFMKIHNDPKLQSQIIQRIGYDNYAQKLAQSQQELGTK